jgi:tetratricopeptide (TPR) repeat protein/CHAT domain-containing protein
MLWPWILRLALLLVARSYLFGFVCVPLQETNSISLSVPRSGSACVTVDVRSEQPIQLMVEQPVDLEIELTSGATQIVFDSFEFGLETATISERGTYRVVLRQVDKSGSSVSLHVSRKFMSLQQSIQMRKAETMATIAKRSEKSADIEDSLQLWKAIDDRSAIARTHLKAGDAEIGLGNMSSAYKFYEQALEICRSLRDFRCMAEAANNSGFAAQQSGDFEPAMERLTEAARDWQEIGEKAKEGQTLSNMGLLFWYTNDFEKAISLYDRARERLRSRDTMADARVLNNLGLCYQSLGEFAKARAYFEQAVAVESSRPEGARAAVHARLNLGRNRMLEGQTLAAQSVLQRAVKDASALAYRPALADSLNALGQNLLERRQIPQAEDTLKQALHLHQVLGDKRSEASDFHNLGMVASINRDKAARSYFVQAAAIRQQCGLREAAADSLYSLAALDRDEEDLSAAAEKTEQALRLLESVRAQVPGPELRASYYARKRRFFDLSVSIAMAQGGRLGAEEGLLAAERGRARALLDTLAEGSLIHNIPQDLLNRRKSVERQIDLRSYRISGVKPEQEANLRRQIEGLIAESEAVEARIREKVNTERLQPALVSIGELRGRLLPRDGALIEYHLATPASYLWLVTPEGTQVFHLPSQMDIEAQSRDVVALFARVLDRKRSPVLQASFQRKLRALSSTLLGPLRESARFNRLIIVPDSILNQVPFAALQLPYSDRSLGLDLEMIQVPAASFLIAGRQARPFTEFPQSLLGVADPVFSADDPRVSSDSLHTNSISELDLARLPFVEDLEKAGEIIPASRKTILRGFDASAEMLRRTHVGDFAVVHFSTHALIDDRIPELSRIALSMVTPRGLPVDGFLHPYHLAALHLNGSTVVFSACGTALGKQVIGEGLAGFTASLFEAGAAQLVLSLSEVDAEASAEFFGRVYKNFFAARPLNMERSMLLARRSLAQSARWSDPFYWASFIVMGRPSQIPQSRSQ